MKKIIALLSTLVLFTSNAHAFYWDETSHFIAWGDEEGVLKRKGEDLSDKNEALPLMMKRLVEIDKTNKIDGILHTGDFVRFDPDETYYKNFLGDFLDRFYPTSGGDQEFYLGKYQRFVNSAPHLKMLYTQRASIDGNGLEYYYHTILKNTHVISLYSPDDFRNKDNTQYKGLNVYNNAESIQFKWLENLLFNIRKNSNDQRPIIILSHGPVFNGSRLLVKLFDKYKVNLVLNGDAHVFAHKKYNDTEYFVTGMMGDRYLASCEAINSPKNPYYLENYSDCFPEKPVSRKKGEAFYFAKDHYLDITISKNTLKVKVIDVETGNEISYK
jgi:predicted MPP superfamily phosphohydrolase